MKHSSFARWDRLATDLEDAVLNTADSELLAEPGSGDRVSAITALLVGAMSSMKPVTSITSPRVPKDRTARRELLRLLLGPSGAFRVSSAAFSDEDEVSDTEVESMLRKLLDGESSL